MAERSRDWLRQAEADLQLARSARDVGRNEWSAFACHQAAGKAIKALYQHLHLEAWGHALVELLRHLPQQASPDEQLVDRAKVLDRHYIPTRYPNGFERGAPMDYYSRKDAEESIEHAQAILEFCQNHTGDAAGVRRAADEYARELLTTHPEVEEVVVFGSFANDTYAPGSDLDVFIILREANDSPRERMWCYRPERFPVPLDVFAFTRAEMEERKESPLVKAMEKSRWRYGREL